MYRFKNVRNAKYRFTLLIVLVGAFIVSGCSDSSTSGELGSTPPDASFTVTAIEGQENTYLLESTTEGAFMWQWDLGNGNGFQKGTEVDTAFYSQAGNYDIKLRAFGEAGSDTASSSLNVAQNACVGDLKLLTGCDGKTWVLNPEAGAVWIGTADFSTRYFAYSEGDVQGRSCQFNDEYTFNLDLTMNRDLVGDIWVDAEGDANPFPTDIISSGQTGCYDWSAINSQYSAWGSDTFNYSLSGNQLEISGDGAYMGLYKVGDSGITATPESEISYEILELAEDRLVMAAIYSDINLAFRYTYTPKQ
jgi:PKD repeat protein